MRSILEMPNARYRVYTTFAHYYKTFFYLTTLNLSTRNTICGLEKKLSSFLGTENVIAIPMARVGIYYAVKSLITSGQEVIMSPYTIADVVNMVICAGGHPVFADIQRETCNIDPKKIENLINKNTGAVLVTHLHGISAPVDEIQLLCEKNKISLIEDAAQAFGASHLGKMLGTYGDVGVYSFGLYKNITSWYGGALAIKDKKLSNKIKSEITQLPPQSRLFLFKRVAKALLTDLLTHPILFKSLTFRIFKIGFLRNIEAINKRVRTELDTSRKKHIPKNYLRQITQTQAGLLINQIDSVKKDTEKRIEAARLYHKALKSIKEIILPPFNNDSYHIYTYFPIQYKNTNSLLKWLMKHNRDIGAQHLKNCADLESFKDFYLDCPNARLTAKEVILLPTYPRYSLKDVNRTIEAIKSYFQTKT